MGAITLYQHSLVSDAFKKTGEANLISLCSLQAVHCLMSSQKKIIRKNFRCSTMRRDRYRCRCRCCGKPGKDRQGGDE